MLPRMWLAARLDAAFYETVEADPRFNREAFFVVMLVALLGGLGMLTAPEASPMRFFLGILGTLFSWVAWSGITLFIGTRITRGAETQSNLGEMLRVLGYAHSPQALMVLGSVPLLGTVLVVIAGIWSLIAGVVAIRQALDFDTPRALLTVGMGWLLVLALQLTLKLIT